MPADNRAVVERTAFQRARQQTATTEIESLERQLIASRRRITPAVIAEFGQALRAKLVAGDPDSHRAYVALLVEQVTLSANEIHSSGTRSALEHLLVSDKPPFVSPALSFDRKWCPTETKDGHSNCWTISIPRNAR